MKLKTYLIAGAIAWAAFASVAHSATTFNFGGATGTTASKTFTADGITVVATGVRAGPFGLFQFSGNVTQTADGLGVGSFPDTSGEIDGFILRDALILTFDQLVKLTEAAFGDVQRNDDWDIYIDNGSGSFSQLADDSTDNPFQFGDSLVKRIAFGADGLDDDFRVKSLTVSAVPLPAGGLLLIGAVGGLAALRRRRKV